MSTNKGPKTALLPMNKNPSRTVLSPIVETGILKDHMFWVAALSAFCISLVVMIMIRADMGCMDTWVLNQGLLVWITIREKLSCFAQTMGHLLWRTWELVNLVVPLMRVPAGLIIKLGRSFFSFLHNWFGNPVRVHCNCRPFSMSPNKSNRLCSSFIWQEHVVYFCPGRLVGKNGIVGNWRSNRARVGFRVGLGFFNPKTFLSGLFQIPRLGVQGGSTEGCYTSDSPLVQCHWEIDHRYQEQHGRSRHWF